MNTTIVMYYILTTKIKEYTLLIEDTKAGWKILGFFFIATDN